MFAQKTLEGMHLPCVRRLQLARMYSLKVWVPDALRTLLASPLNELSLIQYQELGIGAVMIIVKAKEKLSQYRLKVAHVVPKLNEDPEWSCKTHAKCVVAWKAAWWEHVARRIFHPTSPIAIADIPPFVRNLVIPDLSWNCQYDVMENWVSTQAAGEQSDDGDEDG